MSAKDESLIGEKTLAEHILSDLCCTININPFGSLRKHDRTLALKTGVGTKRRIHGCTKHQMMISYEIEKGSIMPPHHHDVEQISYIVKGKVRVSIGEDQVFIAEAGDSYTEPANKIHTVEALEDTLSIECFTPPRPIFLIMEAAAYHDLGGAYEDIKKELEALREYKLKMEEDE